MQPISLFLTQLVSELIFPSLILEPIDKHGWCNAVERKGEPFDS